jgi:hypothetical protein
LEKAAFKGFVALPASLAIAAVKRGLKPKPPKRLAAPPPTTALRIRSRLE